MPYNVFIINLPFLNVTVVKKHKKKMILLTPKATYHLTMPHGHKMSN